MLRTTDHSSIPASASNWLCDHKQDASLSVPQCSRGKTKIMEITVVALNM